MMVHALVSDMYGIMPYVFEISDARFFKPRYCHLALCNAIGAEPSDGSDIISIDVSSKKIRIKFLGFNDLEFTETYSLAS